jgi:hypothetical protein
MNNCDPILELIKERNAMMHERDASREAFRELWQSADAYLPVCDPETIKRWRKAAGWEEGE